jgi:hypothetical protein
MVARMVALMLVVGLVRLTVLVDEEEEFIMVQYDIH